MATAPRPHGYVPRSLRRRRDAATEAGVVARKTELSASERGYDWQWVKFANAIRDERGGLCEDCLDEGGLPMAMQSLIDAKQAHACDHVIPLHVRPDLKLNSGNIRIRCDRHHAIKTAEDVKRYGAADRSIAFPAT